MTFVRVNWRHAEPDQPCVLYAELDDERREVRKIDLFPDGRWGFADGREEVGGTRLGEVAVPSLEELNADPVYDAVEIEPEEFEQLWSVRRHARPMTDFPDEGGPCE
jgi:hypothetical protein